jgi:hypothetical protein
MLPGWTTDVPRNPVQSTEEEEEEEEQQEEEEDEQEEEEEEEEEADLLFNMRLTHFQLLLLMQRIT